MSPSERDLLLQRLGPFQPDTVIDKDDFHFGHTWELYSKYINEEEKRPTRTKFVVMKYPFLRMSDLTICGSAICSGCGKIMGQCDGILIGPYCGFHVLYHCSNYSVM